MNILAFVSITTLLLFILNSKLDYIIENMHTSPVWKIESIIHQNACMVSIRLLASAVTVLILLRVIGLMVKLIVMDSRPAPRKRSKPIAFIYTKVDFYEHAPPRRISNTHCTICLCEGSNDVVLECGHVFHWNCVRPWLDLRNACPLCKRAQQRRGVDENGRFVEEE